MKISSLLIILGSYQGLGQNWESLTESETEINMISSETPSVATREFKGHQLISKGNFGVFRSNKKPEMFVNISALASKNWLNLKRSKALY